MRLTIAWEDQTNLPFACMNSIGSRAFFERLHGGQSNCRFFGQFDPPRARG